jgi:acetylornithine aminotransferase/acetylornithine/N-succinyldiaminopimelate aminotransferase
MLEKTMNQDSQYYMNTFGKRTPVMFTGGKGPFLYSSEDKEYLDLLSGLAVNALGYGHQGLINAIKDQSEKLIHCSNLYYIGPQAELAEKLTALTGYDKVFFANSGAEANEGAIKLARKHFYKSGENKFEVISTNNSFHGRTIATVAATGQEKYQIPFRPMPQGFKQVPYNNLEELEKAITPQTACILVEPIQGEGGVIPATKEYLKGLRQICDDKGIVLIFDEIQTGMGRTGNLFAFQKYGVEPDIFTSSKALGGGLPIGAIIAKGEVANSFEPGDHGTTFGGNPLSCSAALAVIKALTEDGILKEVDAISCYFISQLEKLKEELPIIKEVRGMGLIMGAALDSSIDGKKVVAKAFEKGLLINCAGLNTLRFLPPLIITKDDIDKGMAILKEVLKEF